MSISVTQKPLQPYIAVHDPQLYVCEDIAAPVYKPAVKVTIAKHNGTTYIDQIVLKYPLNVDKNAAFDLSKALQSLVNTREPRLSDDLPTADGNKPYDVPYLVSDIQITFITIGASTATGVPIDSGIATTITFYAYAGSFRNAQTQNWTANTQNPHMLDSTFDTPLIMQTDIKVRDEDHGAVDFIFQDGSTDMIYFQLKYYDAAGTTLSTNNLAVAAGTETSLSTLYERDYGIMRWFGYPASLAHCFDVSTNTGHPEHADNDGWTRYVIVPKNSSNVSVGAGVSFNRVDSECGAYMRFQFLNRLGGVDYLTVYGVVRQDEKVTKNQFRRVRGESRSDVDGSFTYNTYDRSLSTMTIPEHRTFRMKSHFMTDEENILMRELVRSRYVFATLPDAPDEFYPIVITTDSYTELQQQVDKLVQYDLSWQYSVDLSPVIV